MKEEAFLTKQSELGGRAARKYFLILEMVVVVLIAGIGYALKDTFDLNDYRDKKILVCLIIVAVIMLASGFIALLRFRTWKHGENLDLMFEGEDKAAVAEIINREIAEGKLLFDEYVYEDSIREGKRTTGERLVLTPSYFLICRTLPNASPNGRVFAIPTDKIYCICAQIGEKGRSSFMARLQVYTEKEICYIDGGGCEWVEGLADKLHQYIPDAFSEATVAELIPDDYKENPEYAMFRFPYYLEMLFEKDRASFIQLCKEYK